MIKILALIVLFLLLFISFRKEKFADYAIFKLLDLSLGVGSPDPDPVMTYSPTTLGSNVDSDTSSETTAVSDTSTETTAASEDNENGNDNGNKKTTVASEDNENKNKKITAASEDNENGNDNGNKKTIAASEDNENGNDNGNKKTTAASEDNENKNKKTTSVSQGNENENENKNENQNGGNVVPVCGYDYGGSFMIYDRDNLPNNGDCSDYGIGAYPDCPDDCIPNSDSSSCEKDGESCSSQFSVFREITPDFSCHTSNWDKNATDCSQELPKCYKSVNGRNEECDSTCTFIENGNVTSCYFACARENTRGSLDFQESCRPCDESGQATVSQDILSNDFGKCVGGGGNGGGNGGNGGAGGGAGGGGDSSSPKCGTLTDGGYVVSANCGTPERYNNEYNSSDSQTYYSWDANGTSLECKTSESQDNTSDWNSFKPNPNCYVFCEEDGYHVSSSSDTFGQCLQSGGNGGGNGGGGGAGGNGGGAGGNGGGAGADYEGGGGGNGGGNGGGAGADYEGGGGGGGNNGGGGGPNCSDHSSDESSCTRADGCRWVHGQDASWGYCFGADEETPCYAIYDSGDCNSAPPGCSWNQDSSDCQNKECWEYTDSGGCEDAPTGCDWNTQGDTPYCTNV
jgi:hypothetical protein